MNARAYAGVSTSPCPNKGCHATVVHDADLDPRPCSDGCWLQMGLRVLVQERGAALTTGELHELLQSAIDEADGREPEDEHPASVALYDLGRQYEVKVGKYRASGDGSAALLLSGVLEDLELVRAMLSGQRGPVQAPAEPNVLDLFEALKCSVQQEEAAL